MTSGKCILIMVLAMAIFFGYGLNEAIKNMRPVIEAIAAHNEAIKK